ncbi:MAG: outer membrane beta-barrel protein [bacterium]|nr:outer membrane beta-barrel protein [bacterium]
MKKVIVLLVVLLVSFTLVSAEEDCARGKFSLTVGAGMRNFSETLYEDVYDKGGVSFNIDFGVKIMKSLEVFLHSDLFSVDGELTYTQETTTLKITPMELGARFLFGGKSDSCKAKFFPYIGAGAGYYMYKEESVIGTIDEKKLGFFFEGGLRFYALGKVFIDAKVKNVMLTVESESGADIKLGGFSYMGGIGITF